VKLSEGICQLYMPSDDSNGTIPAPLLVYSQSFTI